MAEVEVGLRASVEDNNFAVLIRRHRAGVNVRYGSNFLQRDLEAAISSTCRARGPSGPCPRTHTPPVTNMNFIQISLATD